MITWIKAHNKAIVGFLVAGVTMYLQLKDHGLTQDEWWEIIFSAIAGGGIVFAVPNITQKKTPDDSNKV